ncbi:MAG: hypothetical protein IPH57_05450 [Saprospiraceae bacterium]|nr:hypothetical protein [Saprospiraceae bacterium]
MPVNAIKESIDGKYVYVAESKGDKTVAKRIGVEIGQTYNGVAEILKD